MERTRACLHSSGPENYGDDVDHRGEACVGFFIAGRDAAKHLDGRMPVHVRGGARKDELEWRRPNRPSLQNLFANPIYAGAYVCGVRPTDRRRQKAGRPSTGRRLLRAEEAADFRRARPIEKDAPPTTLAPQALLERLAAEYVFAQLCQAGMHAFEAENEARMLAMTSAKTNIETKLAGLSQRERQLRQEEITTEIVELAAGTKASASRRK
jgi:hypothetical protein